MKSLGTLNAALVFLLATVGFLTSVVPAGDKVHPRRQRLDTAEKFIGLLQDGNFDDAANMLSEPLRKETDPAGLRSFIDGAEFHCGPLLKDHDASSSWIGGVHLFGGRTEWKDASWMNLWVSFDDALLINGMWLVSEEGYAPRGFPSGGLSLGRLHEAIELARHSLTAHVVDVDGQPLGKTFITFWRTVDPNEVQAFDRPSLWQDESGRHWMSMNSAATNDSLLANDLVPGKYRVTAQEGHRDIGRFGLSDTVEIEPGAEPADVRVVLQPGVSLTINPVDVETGRPTPRPVVALTPIGGKQPPQRMQLGYSANEPVFIESLPEGQYRVEASLRADNPNGLQYDLADQETIITVGDSKEQLIELPLRARLLTNEEIDQRWPWTAFGRVTDEFQQPISNAKVQVATGWGSLKLGGTTTTDANGDFRLRFRGMNQRGNAVQVAVFSASHDGYVLQSSSSPSSTMMARELPELKLRYGHTTDEIPLENQPFRIDFVLAKPAVLSVSLIDEAGNPCPDKIYLSRGSTTCASRRIRSSDQAKDVSQWQVLPGVPWRFATDIEDFGSVRSHPFTLPSAGSYDAIARLHRHDPTGVHLLSIEELVATGDRDTGTPIIGDDPFARPPVSSELQERGHELLRQMANHNRLWLDSDTRPVDDFAYRFHFEGGESRRWQVKPEKPGAGVVRRGISYDSAVHHLAAHPEDAIFRQVEENGDRIMLSYTLTKPIRISAGNGVLGTWSGFISSRFVGGTLELDATRLVPLKHYGEELTERYSQFQELNTEQFVPLAIAVNNGGHKFRWTFQTFEPGLWLFAKSIRQTDGEPSMIATLSEVEIEGLPREPIKTGLPEWFVDSD